MVRATSSSRMVGKNTFAVGDSGWAGVRAVLGRRRERERVLSSRGLWVVPRVAQVLYSLAFYPWKDPRPARLVATPILCMVSPDCGELRWLLSGAFVVLLTAGFLLPGAAGPPV